MDFELPLAEQTHRFLQAVDLKRKFDPEIGAKQIPGIPRILPQPSEMGVVWEWRGYFVHQTPTVVHHHSDHSSWLC